MNEKEFEQLKGMLEQLKSINNKLDKLIGKTNEQDSPANKLLRKATSKETTEKEYCQTLVDLNKLPFNLSAKQFAWVIFNTPKHAECGEAIENFIKKQFEKHSNKVEFIDQVGEVLRNKYANDNNSGFIEKMIARLQEI